MPEQYTSPSALARFAQYIQPGIPSPSYCQDFGPCTHWTAFVAPDGYGLFWLNGRTYVAHKAAWILASGRAVPDGMKVCHVCDVRRCVRSDDIGAYVVDGIEYERRGHLWLGTTAANQADMVAKGRSLSGDRNPMHLHPERAARGLETGRYTHPERTARGSRHGATSLTEATVSDVRSRYAAGGVTLDQLAAEYGTGKSTMHRIVHRLTWRHV